MSERLKDPSSHLPFVRWARWVRLGILRELRPTARDVATFLAACSGPGGNAFPAVSTISKKIRHTRTSIFRGLKELAEWGILRSGGRVRSRRKNVLGPRIYTIEEPPGSQEAYDLSVLAARTDRTILCVSPARMYRARDSQSRFSRVGAAAQRPPRPATNSGPCGEQGPV